jgi:two-component sensor histidine kinase
MPVRESIDIVIRPDALLLLEELSHRVRNEFSAAIGIVALAAHRTTSQEARVELEKVCRCLHAFAKVHIALEPPRLEHPVDCGVYLDSLCREISRAKLSPRAIAIELAECSVRLCASHCWYVGLIISELVCNAFRHAFGEGGGTIRVRVWRERLTAFVCVEDNGVGLGSQPPGRGGQIVAALAACLGGQVDYASFSDGTQCTLRFPLALT